VYVARRNANVEEAPDAAKFSKEKQDTIMIRFDDVGTYCSFFNRVCILSIHSSPVISKQRLPKCGSSFRFVPSCAAAIQRIERVTLLFDKNPV